MFGSNVHSSASLSRFQLNVRCFVPMIQTPRYLWPTAFSSLPLLLLLAMAIADYENPEVFFALLGNRSPYTTLLDLDPGWLLWIQIRICGWIDEDIAYVSPPP